MEREEGDSLVEEKVKEGMGEEGLTGLFWYGTFQYISCVGRNSFIGSGFRPVSLSCSHELPPNIVNAVSDTVSTASTVVVTKTKQAMNRDQLQAICNPNLDDFLFLPTKPHGSPFVARAVSSGPR